MMHRQEVIVHGKKVSPGQIWIYDTHMRGRGPEVFIVEKAYNPDNIKMHGVHLPFSLIDFTNMRLVNDFWKETAMIQSFIVKELQQHNLEVPGTELSLARPLAAAIVLIITIVILWLTDVL